VKQLHAARHAFETHLIRGFLASQGIEAQVRGEYLTSGWGELPVDVCSVWIMEDEQFARANELLVAFLSGSYARKFSGEHWTCPHCTEKLEGQFTTCWNCGTVKPAATEQPTSKP
jgi:hypothetical protein